MSGGIMCSRTGLRNAAFVLAGLLLWGAVPLHAQNPGPSDCTTRGGAKRGDGADLQCRMDRLLEKQQTLLTSIKDRMGPCTDSPNRCELLEKRFERAQKAHDLAVRGNGRLRPDDFVELNRKRKGKPDSTGSSSSISTLSTFNTSAAPEEDVDESIGVDLADHLDDVGDALQVANDTFVEITPPVVTPPVHPSLYDYKDPAHEPSYPNWLHAINPSVGARYGVLVAFEVAKGLMAWTEKVCDQTAVAAGFGGNTSSACVALALVVGGLELTHELMEFGASDTDGWEAHGAYVRAGQIFDNLNSLNSTLGSVAGTVGQVGDALDDLGPQIAQHDEDIKARLDSLEQQLKVSYAFQRVILKLLLTQDGFKTIDPSLLVCKGDDCPLVEFTCPGGQCKFPLK